MNALTTGIDEPSIVVQSALLDPLDDDEVVAVLGHELGHIHARHALFQTLARVLVAGGGAAMGLAGLLTMPLQTALAKWSRCAELTCDRAGLLACRDVGAALGVLLKLAGGGRPGTTSRTRMQLAPFIRQARKLADLEAQSLVDGLLANLFTLGASHPFIAWRVMNLIDWVEHGSYLEILSGDYARAPGTAALAPVTSAS